MRLLTASLSAGLFLTIAFSSALGQGSDEARARGRATTQNRAISQTADVETKVPLPTTAPDEPSIRVYLVGGGQMQVDEVTQTPDGFWYRRGTLTTFMDKTRVARIERPEDVQARALALAETRAGEWTISEASRVENFFLGKFNRRLPLTAFGQSDLHTRWGLDHRQGIDVGLHPDSPEGRALINFLRTEKIPFLAFRSALPGVATGPHIHIGKGSHRLNAR